VIGGLPQPVYVTAPRSEPNRLYVVEKAGVIRVIEKGKLRANPYLDIRSWIDSSGSEQGLFSVAFDPHYAKNHRFYVDYTNLSGDTRVVEFRSKGLRAVLRSARIILKVRQPFANHNGGQLQFGPDGKLYVGMGDGGSAEDPQNNGQNPNTSLAKLLRTGVPSVRWEIAGYGLRNPWRFSFDRATGDLYIGDVGQDRREEIDFRAKGAPPANFGWSRYEANLPLNDVPLDPPSPLVFPVTDYGHDQGCSVTGGYVYRGPGLAEARGRYFYGDWCAGTVWSLRVVDGKATDVRKEPFRVPSLSSFGEGARGELYLVSLDGAIFKLTG
jgi:glucose/arabinose dehydrogenase